MIKPNRIMEDLISSLSDNLSSFTNGNDLTDSNVIDNFYKIFNFEEKANISNIYSTLIGNAFIIGTILFLCLMVISVYLDSSLRNQIFYIFDNCTNEDYVFEYIVKIRFGLLPEFSCYTDLIIEFYNNKFKPLSKFIVNGNYLYNGLNIGTKLCPGMKMTSLYLFKHNSLNNLEYCRAYLNSNDPNIVIHLYSIEVGNNKEVQVFFFNHGINKSNPNAIQLSLVVEEPITAKYNGPIMETSYLQASLFIYFFFLLTFFFNRLTPTQEKMRVFKGFDLDRSLLINSTLVALFCGVLYLIFRDFIHYKYSSSNGSSKWSKAKTGILLILLIGFLFLCIISILTEFKNEKQQTIYFTLVLYSNCTLLYWIPIAFFYFYLFSTSNYHLGRIIMKSTNQQAEKSRVIRSQKNRRKNKIEEEEDSFTEESTKNLEATKDKASKQRSGQPPVQTVQRSGQTQLSLTPKLQPGINYTQGTYIPIYDPNVLKQYPFNIKSPITYINDPKFTGQMKTARLLPVQSGEMSNSDLQTNIVTPYKSIRIKVPKSSLRKFETTGVRDDRDKIMKQMKTVFKKIKSLETVIPDQKSFSFKTIQKAKTSPSKTSIGSTGSDYYAAMFKDGKVPKVGSISQYGSLLRQ